MRIIYREVRMKMVVIVGNHIVIIIIVLAIKQEFLVEFSVVVEIAIINYNLHLSFLLYLCIIVVISYRKTFLFVLLLFAQYKQRVCFNCF